VIAGPLVLAISQASAAPAHPRRLSCRGRVCKGNELRFIVTLDVLRWSKSASEAEVQCKVGATIVAIHAIIANAQFASMAQSSDRRIFLGLLGIELAVAGGISLNSRLFACIAVLFCICQTIWILDFDSYRELALLLSLNLIGCEGAIIGARGSFAFNHFSSGARHFSRGSRILGIAVTVLLLGGIIWLLWTSYSYFSLHD
jgi:hypothetical protein